MENVKGLIPGHIYTLMSAIHIRINGKKEKIVKLRNPWGDHGNLVYLYSTKNGKANYATTIQFGTLSRKTQS